MAKTYNLNDYLYNQDEIESAVIIETEVGEIEQVLITDLDKYDPQKIKKIIPKPYSKDIIDGSSIIAQKYIKKEFPFIAEFFKSRNVKNPVLCLNFDTPNEWFLTIEFPIPSKIKKKDGTFYKRPVDQPTEKLLFLINDYPNLPPVGFHVTNDAPSEMIKTLGCIFGNHKYDKVMIGGVNEDVKTKLSKHWSWICFHYGSGKWKYNRNFWDNTQNKKSISKYSLTGYLYYIHLYLFA